MHNLFKTELMIYNCQIFTGDAKYRQYLVNKVDYKSESQNTIRIYVLYIYICQSINAGLGNNSTGVIVIVNRYCITCHMTWYSWTDVLSTYTSIHTKYGCDCIYFIVSQYTVFDLHSWELISLHGCLVTHTLTTKVLSIPIIILSLIYWEISFSNWKQNFFPSLVGR